MLRLTKKITSDQRWVGVVVRDDCDLGGASQKINAALSEQLSFGLSDELVPGPAKHVCRRNDSHPVGHESQCLDTAQDEYPIGAGHLHSADSCGVVALGPDRRGTANN